MTRKTQHLDWRQFQKGAAHMGGRGGLSFFKVYQSPERPKTWSVGAYLIGAADAGGFDTITAAKNYAEIEFGEWLKRTKLQAVI